MVPLIVTNMGRVGLLVALSIASVARPAHGEPTVLRFASVAPDGTSWARELKAFGRDIEQRTSGNVKVKWYFGSIAGDELTVIDRIRRAQLDGMAAGLVCDRLAPSMHVMRTIGIFLGRDEHRYVLTRLRPKLDQEFQANGFVDLGVVTLGGDVLFSKSPVHNLEELRRLRTWAWSIDEVSVLMLGRMGLKLVPLPLEEGRAAADAGKLDAFVALPNTMLAYQWTPRVKYFVKLPFAPLAGCVFVSERAFERLPPAAQTEIRSAGAKFVVRFDDMTLATEQELLGGLFQKQGLIELPVSEEFRAAFHAAARAARENLGKLVSPAQLEQMQAWLADYRAEHGR
jgi:TRAP-type C4-dicarboxylate transport system substrate-binding protein